MKRELRKSILKERMALSGIEVETKSSSIGERLFVLPEFINAKTVMLFLSFRKEVETQHIIHKCFDQGKRVVIPITDLANTRLIPSELLDYPGDLTTGTYEILEPKKECVRPVNPDEIDLVLVPGVAFDVMGNRLGYGGGFYDRFLPALVRGTPFIALVYEFQIKDEVYPEPHDYPVHYVITEERVIKGSSVLRSK